MYESTVMSISSPNMSASFMASSPANESSFSLSDRHVSSLLSSLAFDGVSHDNDVDSANWCGEG
jgi:hypothetical protein